MDIKPVGWAPDNPWFELGFETKQQMQIENHRINIMPLPYFLASKFTAHTDRGGNAPRMSHDFEDIVYIIDNRTDWHYIVQQVEEEVKSYLFAQFQNILHSNKMQKAILGNLYYETQEERYSDIISKIKFAIDA